MSNPHPKRGMKFRHDSMLDPDWVPDIKAGQKYSDAPKAILRVTSVSRDAVFYTYADAPERSGGRFIMSLSKRWEQMTVLEE